MQPDCTKNNVAVAELLSTAAVCCLLSAVCCLLSAVAELLSTAAVCCLLFVPARLT